MQTRHFLVQPVSQSHDVRTIDHRCIAILEFGVCVRSLPCAQIGELGQLLLRMVIPQDGDNCHVVSNCVYESLARVSGLLEALRIGVGDEIACVLGCIAAERSGPDLTTKKRAFDIVTRRVRNAGRLLSAARKDRAAWAILFDAHADLDSLAGSHTNPNREERLKAVAAVAMGTKVLIFPDNCPQRVLDDPNGPHIRFQRSMEMLVNSKGSWSLVDALIPCNNVPIRTKHYVTYVEAVSHYANKLVTSLLPSSSLDTPESRCAWALVAISNPNVQPGESFAAVMTSWSKARAHEPPEKGTGCWITIRAMLSRPVMDVVKLAEALQALVSAWAPCIDAKNNMFGKIASMCVSTRTKNGLRLICVDPSVADGLLHRATGESSDSTTPLAIDCLSFSPSGALELGDYEPGFSEWKESCEQHTKTLAADVARVIQQRISHCLAVERPTSLTDAALRLSLMPDNVLTKPWKVAIESFQPALERAIRQEVGRFPGDSRPDDEDTLPSLREGAIRAVVFRRRCLRALADASRHPAAAAAATHAAFVTWLCNDLGECTVFARKFTSDAEKGAEVIVIEYERLLRTAVSNVHTNEAHPAKIFIHKSTRAETIGVTNFVDTQSRHALNGSETSTFQYCSPNAVVSIFSCAVSVVRWQNVD